ncbi:MAG: aldo/keto reductase [Planctomycetota bacterium]|nr:aldo/keto reductase [Planctomycetota bacterium]
MSPNRPSPLSRRDFLHDTALLAGAVIGGGAALAAETPAVNDDRLPRRVLGRTNLDVTCLTLGSAPCGIAPAVSVQEVARIVNLAIDEGINFIDTAPKYVKAEEGVGLALGPRRKEIYLATKVWCDTIPDAEKSLANSFKTLKTDYVDVLYFHQLGSRELKSARTAEGVFTWLLAQKKAGKCRFVGISGHNLPGRFPQFLDSGEVDVLLTVVNYVDRHTYQFEEHVLPLAQKHQVGIVAMKVYGGPDPKTGSWNEPTAKPLIGEDQLQLAVRYTLSTPGVVTANIGVHTVEQLKQNIQLVKRFQPLNAEERQLLVQRGQELAAKWGPHFGPVQEENQVGVSDRLGRRAEWDVEHG